MLLCTVEGAISGVCTCQKWRVVSDMKSHHTQSCCQDLIAGGSLQDTNCESPFWLIWTRLKDQSSTYCSFSMERNPASCQYSYILSCYLRMRPRQGSSREGGRFLEPRNKSSTFSQLFQLWCLKTQLWGQILRDTELPPKLLLWCSEWSQPSGSFLIKESQLSPVFRSLGINI